jgi:hypothetical protein
MGKEINKKYLQVKRLNFREYESKNCRNTV